VGGNQPTFSIIIAELSSERCEEEEAHTLQRLYSPLLSDLHLLVHILKKQATKKISDCRIHVQLGYHPTHQKPGGGTRFLDSQLGRKHYYAFRHPVVACKAINACRRKITQ
jgi:hypothetical protein